MRRSRSRSWLTPFGLDCSGVGRNCISFSIRPLGVARPCILCGVSGESFTPRKFNFGLSFCCAHFWSFFAAVLLVVSSSRCDRTAASTTLRSWVMYLQRAAAMQIQLGSCGNYSMAVWAKPPLTKILGEMSAFSAAARHEFQIPKWRTSLQLTWWERGEAVSHVIWHSSDWGARAPLVMHKSCMQWSLYKCKLALDQMN